MSKKRRKLSDLEVVKLFRESVFKSMIAAHLAMIVVFGVFGLIYVGLIFYDVFVWKGLFNVSGLSRVLTLVGLAGLLGVTIFGIVVGIQGCKRGKRLLAWKRKQMLFP